MFALHDPLPVQGDREEHGEVVEINNNIGNDIMTKKVMEGSHAIAEAVKLCEPGVIAAYPITPQLFNELSFIE